MDSKDLYILSEWISLVLSPATLRIRAGGPFFIGWSDVCEWECEYARDVRYANPVVVRL